MLTIAIPTYNRNEILRSNLDLLIPQLTVDSQLLIIDNASPVPVSLAGLPLPGHAPVRLVRNLTNIGGNGNILRCFELCDTDWVWVLGDDDPISPTAVQQVLAAIGQHPDCLFINFAVEGGRKRQTNSLTHNRIEFLEAVSHFGEILFLSADIFNAGKVRSYLDFGYHYAYSCGPHIAMLLAAMKDGGSCLFVSEAIIRWERPVIENRGSLIPIALGLPSLLELPLSSLERRLLARTLRSFPNITAVAHQLLLRVVYDGMTPHEARHQFSAIIKRIPSFFPNRRTLNIVVCRIALLFPRFAFAVVVRPLYKWVVGQETGRHKIGLDRL